MNGREDEKVSKNRRIGKMDCCVEINEREGGEKNRRIKSRYVTKGKKTKA